ncbi:MAG: serine hydrolase domain-containing protein [Bacteroidota bacterium]
MKKKTNTLRTPTHHLFLILIALLSGCNNSGKREANETVAEDYIKQIDSLIETTDPRIFNGIVLITKGGETKYLKEQGYSDFANKVPISIHDRFRIMSNSKQVTAVLILKEVEKGKIDLQHPISNYLTDLDQTWADTVTVHQLLNMSSGINDIEDKLLFQPGEGYHYSNPGYGLLGRIIQKVTGKSYKTNANNLFKELGMGNTYCYELNGNNDKLINGYSLLNGEKEKVDINSFGFYVEIWNDFLPAGGIVSNAYDLNKWDAMLHKGDILEEGSYQRMVNPTNSGPHAAFDDDTIGYGYGLRIHDKHTITHVGHGGRGFGFVSIKFYIPEKDVDVIIWENIYYRDNFPNTADIIYHFENEIRKIVVNSVLVK